MSTQAIARLPVSRKTTLMTEAPSLLSKTRSANGGWPASPRGHEATTAGPTPAVEPPSDAPSRSTPAGEPPALPPDDGDPRPASASRSTASRTTPRAAEAPQRADASRKITVLLAEDHAVVRQGLRALLMLDGNFTVVGEAQTGREAVKLADQFQPDVVLMDIAMPTLNGISATRQILAANPSARVLILSAHCDDEYVERTSAAGAAGFIEKQMTGEILAKAIRAVAEGKSFFSPTISESLRGGITKLRSPGSILKANGSRLTTRELEVLQLVAEGRANKQVSAELGISIKTVEKHRQHLMDKLNIHDTASLTRYAITMGIIESRVQITTH